MGDAVRVVLVSCDPALRRMSFVPAADPEERRAMKAPAFDAVLDFPLGGTGPELRAEAVFLGGGVAARFLDYAVPGRKNAPVRPRPDATGPVDVKWADPFEVRTASGGAPRPRHAASTRARRPPRSSSCRSARPSWPGSSSGRRT